jgi:hypothetical protein
MTYKIHELRYQGLKHEVPRWTSQTNTNLVFEEPITVSEEEVRVTNCERWYKRVLEKASDRAQELAANAFIVRGERVENRELDISRPGTGRYEVMLVPEKVARIEYCRVTVQSAKPQESQTGLELVLSA